MKYAMFLRGINVGGIKVPMADLRTNLQTLGLQNIQTFLQTGNVIFESDKPISKLKPVIEKMLTEQFNYEAFVLIYDHQQLSEIINDFPFERNENEHSYVILCENSSVIDELLAHKDEIEQDIEDISGGKFAVYWRVPKGKTLDTRFSKIMSKPKYKAVTTNRNINTLEKML